jgi:hypothetical protein
LQLENPARLGTLRTAVPCRPIDPFFRLPQPRLRDTLSPFPTPGRTVLWLVLCSTVSTRLHTVPFQQLNLHSARVRRNRGRLPSSRCIESARTHRARAPALPARASDTTLGLVAPDSFRFARSEVSAVFTRNPSGSEIRHASLGNLQTESRLVSVLAQTQKRIQTRQKATDTLGGFDSLTVRQVNERNLGRIGVPRAFFLFPPRRVPPMMQPPEAAPSSAAIHNSFGDF